MNKDLAFVLVFGSLCAIYYVVFALRKSRFRSTAQRLLAHYDPIGFFSSGKIVGDGYSIEIKKQGTGKYSSLFTLVVADVLPPVNEKYLLKSEFFEKFPDWHFAKVMGPTKERAFFVMLDSQRYVELTPEQKKVLSQWFSRSKIRTSEIFNGLKENKVREVTLSEDSVRVRLAGAVTSYDRLYPLVTLLKSFKPKG